VRFRPAQPAGQFQRIATGLPRGLGAGLQQDTADATAAFLLIHHQGGDAGHGAGFLQHRAPVQGDNTHHGAVIRRHQQGALAIAHHHRQPLGGLLRRDGVAELVDQAGDVGGIGRDGTADFHALAGAVRHYRRSSPPATSRSAVAGLKAQGTS
jgi:hypothetical protein